MRSKLLLVLLLLAGCKPSPDAALEKSLAKNGVKVPSAKGAVTPLAPDAMLVLVERDRVSADFPSAFVVSAAPIALFQFDPTRAAKEGADAKYLKSAADPIIVPVVNAASEYVAKGTHTVMIAAPEPPPAALYEQLRASLSAAGLSEQFRLARAGDGKVGGERLPPR